MLYGRHGKETQCTQEADGQTALGLLKATSRPTTVPSPTDFDVVLELIDAARTRAVAAVNKTLIDLCWSIGEYISRKIAEEDWGKGTVEALADHIQRRQAGMTGFSASNLWRMRQFHDTYRDEPKLAPLVRELSWTHTSRSRWPAPLALAVLLALSIVASGAMTAYLPWFTSRRALST